MGIAGKKPKDAAGRGKRCVRCLPDDIKKLKPTKKANTIKEHYPSGFHRWIHCRLCEAVVRDDGSLEGGTIEYYDIVDIKGGKDVARREAFCNCEVGYYMYRCAKFYGHRKVSVSDLTPNQFCKDNETIEDHGWFAKAHKAHLLRSIGKPDRTLEKAIRDHEREVESKKTTD